MRTLIARIVAQGLAIGSLALALAFVSPAQARADNTDPAAFKQAVQDTLTLIADVLPSDTATAQRALTVLEAGTGLTQREVIADLQQSPPNFADATDRLQALLAALNRPADTSDPAQAQQRLRAVMAMHRYDALHQPQTWLDRLRQWFSYRVKDLLNIFQRESGSLPLPDWVYYVFGAIVLAIVAVLIFSSTRGRLREGSAAGSLTGPRAPEDYFAEADRLAAAGDRVGAIRALCAGVAATLAGERTWEGSPLTVREIFQHAPDPSRLRPLLAPFEAAVYGGRDVDSGTYARAVEVAAAFRQPKELAA
ncbi:MAG TPA: hypothetical protein VND96_09980 [Candidatus Micrarchaeaceae archaeon]|nr:hypothetical protein [Candidatus Micrarchaeaceae archaeon]